MNFCNSTFSFHNLHRTSPLHMVRICSIPLNRILILYSANFWTWFRVIYLSLAASLSSLTRLTAVRWEFGKLRQGRQRLHIDVNYAVRVYNNNVDRFLDDHAQGRARRRRTRAFQPSNSSRLGELLLLFSHAHDQDRTNENRSSDVGYHPIESHHMSTNLCIFVFLLILDRNFHNSYILNRSSKLCKFGIPGIVRTYRTRSYN